MFIGERRLDWAMNRKQRSEREREREGEKEDIEDSGPADRTGGCS